MSCILACSKRCPRRVSTSLCTSFTQPTLTTNSFSAGKPSALVIDIGASSLSVTPIHDGLLLKKGVVRSPLGGNYISSQVRALFSSSNPSIPLNPHYLIASKTPVDAGTPAQPTFRTFAPGTEHDATFRALQEERLLTEFKETIVQVWPHGKLNGHDSTGRSNLETAKSTPARTFEFPDGYNQPFGYERYRAAESVFDIKAALPATTSDPITPQAGQSLPELIKSSLSNVDVDIRPLLLSSVVVCGASSLLHGFTERLSQELQVLYPGMRIRISAPGNVYERRFASWIGGSILASLGTFHQVLLWFSSLFGLRCSCIPFPLPFLPLILFFSREVSLMKRNPADVDLEKGVRGKWAGHCRETMQMNIFHQVSEKCISAMSQRIE